MPWRPATAPPQRLAEAETGRTARSGTRRRPDAGPSARCPTSAPRIPPVERLHPAAFQGFDQQILSPME